MGIAAHQMMIVLPMSAEGIQKVVVLSAVEHLLIHVLKILTVCQVTVLLVSINVLMERHIRLLVTLTMNVLVDTVITIILARWAPHEIVR